MLLDTEQNTKVVYLYVNNFEWERVIDREQNVGHPKSGRLYRAFRNTDTSTYRVMYPIGNTFQGVYLEKLNGYDGYSSDIQEVNVENILNFNIVEEDLREFLKWLENENKDLLSHAFKKKAATAPPQSSSPAATVKLSDIPDEVLFLKLFEILKRRNKELASVFDTLLSLREVDPHVYSALAIFSDYVLNRPVETNSAIDDTWIRFDSELGAGANLSAAMSKLALYAGKDRRTNFEIKDLLAGIRDLFLEVYRKDYETRH